MRWIDVKQGSQEWIDAKLGIPSASNFDKILQPKKLGPSSQCYAYRNKLVAERILRLPVVEIDSTWMQRGTALEREAADYYAFAQGVVPVECGFALTDDGRIGASPDRLVGDDGMLEIKCPSAHVHIGYLLDGLDDAYRLQLQGQLWVMGRLWVDVESYCPGFPTVLVRVLPDAVAHKALAAAVPEFAAAVDEACARIAALQVAA